MYNGLSDTSMLVTFFLITYNQERYVREAIEGAFSQTYSPLEIVISDDCSMDGTFQIIEEMTEKYVGPHKLVVNRNQENLGLIGHMNRITSLSSGELIVYAAGDDISLPHRTEKLVERYLASGRRVSLIHSSVYLIDISGNRVGTRLPPLISGRMDIEEMAVSGALIIGATASFTRKIEETFGPIKFSKCIEDLVMGFRSALTGGLEYIPEPLILYRHESGMTARTDIRNLTYDQWTQRKIRNKENYLAVLAQRIEDLTRIGNVDFLFLLKRKRSEELLMRKVWTRNYGFLKLFSYSIKRGPLRVFVQSLLSEKKWQFFFPVKRFMHKMAS
ncbi:MAG: glycosyltransferase [Chlorobiales bacterium]|nr:glycosyltransferase [Chlorobiales bacterium]